MINKSVARKDIQRIVTSHPNLWTYRYTRHVIRVATRRNPEFIVQVKQLLCDDTDNGKRAGITSEETFTQYYLLAHYYRLFNKLDLFFELVETYGRCFSDCLRFNEEVNCWYYRRKGNWAKAYQHSKRLLDKFDVYDNPGIYGNYISTILGMLDNEYNSRKTDSPINYWTSETERTTDWNFCVGTLREILDSNLRSIGERVGIHYAKMGRLLMFTPQLETMPIEKISNIIDEANRYFEMAIMYEDQNSKNYNKRCMEYRQMQVRSNLLKMDIVERINIQRVEDKLRNLALREEEVKEQLERQTTKSLEIIAVFTAVITLIITAMGFANNFTFAEAVNLILITSCAWCFVYSIFVFMLHSNKRMFKSIMVAILMICIIYLLIRTY